MPEYFLQNLPAWLKVAIPIKFPKTTHLFAIIMSELFELNRSQFLKIFETHQFKGLVSFTDMLKICSSLKIFPDLLDSQDIQKIFSSVSGGSSHKMTYLEFESFLKTIAFKLFGRPADSVDYLEIFLVHIKNFVLKSYGTHIKTCKKRRSESIREKKTLSMSASNNKSVKVPDSTRNLYRKKNFLELVSPSMIKLKKKKVNRMCEVALTDRKTSLSVLNCKFNENSRIVQAKKLFHELRSNIFAIGKKKVLGARKLKNCQRIKISSKAKFLHLKLFFQI